VASTAGAAELDRDARRVLRLLRRGEERRLEELVQEAQRRLRLRPDRAARAVYTLRELGFVEFRDPDPPKSFFGFLFSSRSTWFWLLVTAVALTDVSIALSDLLPPLRYLRYVLGSVFVLYLPGASLIELLYPKGEDLTQLERLALSIGLSLAIVPLVGLVLNYTPWGIRLNPIVISLTFLTLALSIGAVARKHSYHLLAHGGE